MARKKRREPVALFAQARRLADSALRQAAEPTTRAAQLAAGVAALWPAPLVAVLLADAGAEGPEVIDEAGHRRTEWQDIVRPRLAEWALTGEPACRATAPPALGLADHVLHGAAIGWDARHFGALVLALHKRAADAALAEALLVHLADHVSFRLVHEEADRRAQGRYRDLADLTNLVGHEFNNALNALGLQVASIGQRGLPSEQFPELERVRRQVAAAGGMVRRLQDHCHKASLPPEPTDLNGAVRAAVANPLGGVHLELEPRLPRVLGTRLDLERLVAALLRGATTERGAVTVRTGKGVGTAVWLRVEDACTEPDGELLARLFEPFVEARAGDDGVSLALAKMIARRCGGTLRCERRDGGGIVLVAELRAAE
jgi:signal transduction histidine kinase